MPVVFPRFVFGAAVFCAAVHLSAQDGSEQCLLAEFEADLASTRSFWGKVHD